MIRGIVTSRDCYLIKSRSGRRTWRLQTRTWTRRLRTSASTTFHQSGAFRIPSAMRSGDDDDDELVIIIIMLACNILEWGLSSVCGHLNLCLHYLIIFIIIIFVNITDVKHHQCSAMLVNLFVNPDLIVIVFVGWMVMILISLIIFCISFNTLTDVDF